jgi:hypothetical protein
MKIELNIEKKGKSVGSVGWLSTAKSVKVSGARAAWLYDSSDNLMTLVAIRQDYDDRLSCPVNADSFDAQYLRATDVRFTSAAYKKLQEISNLVVEWIDQNENAEGDKLSIALSS